MSESIIDDIDMVVPGNAVIKVIGVGGAGGNAVQEMINADLAGVHFICSNTDLQALSKNSAKTKIQLGEKLTRGLGAGANPAVGKDAAVESINTIRDAIGEADMVFITAGMGGGTGTGAAPVIAQAAKELNCLTIGVVTKPFAFEGSKRMRMAEEGLEELKKYVDCLIVVPNDRLNCIAPKKTPVNAMFKKANEVLLNGVRGVSDVIIREGFINCDFADVRTIMRESGLALMGIGKASGESRAREATQMAIQSPLLENISLESAKGILFTITTARESLTMEEMQEIGTMINDSVVTQKESINIIYGIVYDESLGDELQVTVIATGIEPPVMEEAVIEPTPIFNKPKQAAFGSNVHPFSAGQTAEEPVNPPVEEPAVRPARARNYDAPYESRPAERRYGKRETRMQAGSHNPGEDVFSFEENLELPSFLRRNAN